jgi:hypothetical protein
VSPPSKVEGVVTASTGGESFLGGGATLLFGEDTYIYRGEFEVAEFPEHIFGIGNSVSMADREEITSKHCSTANQLLHRVGPNLFVGGVLNLADYYDMVKEEGSFLDRQEVTGRDGGVSLGLGATLINDSRDYRHNPLTSSFIHPSATSTRALRQRPLVPRLQPRSPEVPQPVARACHCRSGVDPAPSLEIRFTEAS